MRKFLSCGHAANSIDGSGNPSCAICAGIVPIKVVKPPYLIGRRAICPYCKNEGQSDLELPFFEYRPDQEKDSFYCGCMGWD
jgi:hypothetical protein